MRHVLVLLVAAACGGSSTAPPPATAPQLSVVAPGAGPDDVVVAQVNGRPVWGSCVAAQAQRGARDRQAALDECVAFELLAQAAEARGLATDREVVEATRTAMVSQLIASFEDRHQTPDTLGEQMTQALDRAAPRMHRPELRASAYVRVNVPKDASADVEARAKAVMTDVAATLANETGLFGDHLVATARRLSEGRGVVLASETVRPYPREGLEPPYADALFAIPEVGRVSPPVRTSYGWDVILLTDVMPAREQSREQLAAELFPELRRQVFQIWVNQIVRERHVAIAVDAKQLEGVTP